MRCARIRAAAALLFAALATLSVLPSARAADYDLLVLRQDWQPSSCTTSQCTIPAFGVFSVQALVPSSSTSKDPTDCQDGPAFNAAEIPADILDQLNCVLMDNAAAGSNKGLWEAIWNMYGRCTGMTVSDYFNFIVGQYNLQNANTALAEAGIEAGGQLVDRDRVLTALTKAWGKKAWAACDTKTRYLSYVSACFDRYSWELVDCPWDPNAPIDYGQECAGELIIKQGTAPSAACESSFPVTLAGAFPTATPPPPPPPPPSSDPGGGGGGGGGSPTPTTSSSSSTSIGPIIGAVCGGIAVVVAAAVLFLVVRKRRAARHAAATAWDAQTNSKDEEKVEEQANSDSMLDTFVTMHSGDEGQPGGGGSLDGAAGAPTAPATPSIVVASLGTAQPANHERPAGLPADYRTLDSAPTPVSSGTPTATAFASGGSVASGGAVSSGGTVASGGALNSGGTAGYAIVVNSGGTAGSGGASGAPSATPSGQRLLGGGSEIWAINFAELKLLHVVGEGSFGRVYAAEWHSTSVAVKMLYQAPSTAGSGSLSSGGGGSLSGNLAAAANLLAKLEDEADIMFSLRHPNVVQIMGICTNPPCLVTEFCAKGSLANCLRAARSDASMAAQLTWRRRLTMALDAARGLLYLHSRGIVHRDLKGPNLLADEHWRVKVSDFNLSKHLDKTGSTSLAAMNPRWLANEVMQGERATQASDVFAYAVIMWELLTWELPWATTSPWQIVGLVLGGGRLPLPAPEDVPGPDRLPPAVFQQYTALLQSCWAQNPYDRPLLQSVVEQLRSMLAQLGGEAA